MVVFFYIIFIKAVSWSEESFLLFFLEKIGVFIKMVKNKIITYRALSLSLIRKFAYLSIKRDGSKRKKIYIFNKYVNTTRILHANHLCMKSFLMNK